MVEHCEAIEVDTPLLVHFDALPVFINAEGLEVRFRLVYLQDTGFAC